MLTSADRNAIDSLFDRLAEAERKSGPRDAEAEAFIRQKMAAQPGSAYYLAQTVVVQQEALKEAERRIEELEGNGRGMSRNRDPWGRRDAYDDRRQPMNQGGGFLAGAAQTALGVAGGVMLGSFLGSLFGIGSANAADSNDNGDSGQDSSSNDNDAGNDSDFGGDSGGDFGGGDFGGGDF